MLEGRIYAVISNGTDSGTLRRFRQKAWIFRWAHSGADGQNTLAVQPADTRWVWCSAEIGYQASIAELIQ